MIIQVFNDIISWLDEYCIQRLNNCKKKKKKKKRKYFSYRVLYKKYFLVTMCLLTFFFCKFRFIFLRKVDNHWKRKRLLLHVRAILSRCNADNLGKFIAIWYKNLSCVLEWAGLLDIEFLFLLASGVMRWLIFKSSCCFYWQVNF